MGQQVRPFADVCAQGFFTGKSFLIDYLMIVKEAPFNQGVQDILSRAFYIVLCGGRGNFKEQ